MDRSLSSGDVGLLAGIFYQRRSDLYRAQRCFRISVFARPRADRQCCRERALAYFYFSIETLATVGYGDMHPQTNYGHLIAAVEIFNGMSFLAVMTGLIFARFSRPRARFVFADSAVIARHEGQQTLMIRAANARHNTISRANARLWLVRAERTKETTKAAPLLRVKNSTATSIQCSC